MILAACIFSHKHVTFQHFTQISVTTLFFHRRVEFVCLAFHGDVSSRSPEVRWWSTVSGRQVPLAPGTNKASGEVKPRITCHDTAIFQEAHQKRQKNQHIPPSLHYEDNSCFKQILLGDQAYARPP